jgi:PhnB protein
MTTWPQPYLHFPGTAREAMTFYQQVFGGDLELFTLEQFGRDDGPPDAIAHSQLTAERLRLLGSDTTGDEPAVRTEGVMFSLLGAADAATLRRWFAALAERGTVMDDLQERPWGAHDGRVVDRYGVDWLVGWEGAGQAPA